MNNNLVDSIIYVCAILDKNAVQYMIVGGTAVALHGYFRQSISSEGTYADKPDLDLWYNPTYGNYFRLLDALEELGQNVLEFREEKAPDPKKSFFKYEFENFTLDLLPELNSKLNFSASFRKRALVNLKEINISFINYNDLIIDKETTARLKDRIDIEELKKTKKFKN